MSGSSSSVTAARWRAITTECEAHARRLRTAKIRCQPRFPMDADTYASLDDDSAANIDQLIYRFTKLQDALGAKMYPALGSVFRGETTIVPFYDILSTLERAEIVADPDRWQELRELRNQLTHDYDNQPAEGAAYLNKLFDAVDELIAAAEAAVAYVRQTILTSSP